MGNRLGFTGHVFNPETGLYTARFRHYSPRLGRFIQRDPAGFVDGMSLYAGYFAGGLGLDPRGLFVQVGVPFAEASGTWIPEFDFEHFCPVFAQMRLSNNRIALLKKIPADHPLYEQLVTDELRYIEAQLALGLDLSGAQEAFLTKMLRYAFKESVNSALSGEHENIAKREQALREGIDRSREWESRGYASNLSSTQADLDRLLRERQVRGIAKRVAGEAFVALDAVQLYIDIEDQNWMGAAGGAIGISATAVLIIFPPTAFVGVGLLITDIAFNIAWEAYLAAKEAKREAEFDDLEVDWLVGQYLHRLAELESYQQSTEEDE